jgi:hypothetical protein
MAAEIWPTEAQLNQMDAGRGSGEGHGWKVLLAFSGNFSGCRIDSTDKSISKSGQ